MGTSNFEPDFIQYIHLRGQLEHKYLTGRWYSNCIQRIGNNYIATSVPAFLDASAKYPIMYVDDPEDYTQRDMYDDDYVWLIDKEHSIDKSTVDWVPNPFEGEYIHSFRTTQLTGKNLEL